MGEPVSKEGKILHYTNGKTIRELVDKANSLGIQREDVVGIVQGKDCYYIVYYYGG